ncbi:MAG: efflux RND transporter periplasmic adaptor subunit [Wenzhouxiangella sp.]
MNKIAAIVLPPVLIVGAIGLVVVAYINRPQPEERELAPSAMLVDTIEAQQSAGYFRVQAQGTVRPRTETTLAAEVSGRIISVSDRFVAGGFFRAGDVLAEIDPSDYEAALLQAEAELASARAQLADESARSDQARLDWQRMHGTAREPGDLVLRLPQVAGARAAVQAAEASVLRAERNLERTRIRLPYDGLVRNRQANLGQYVSTGTVLAVTFAVDVAEIRLPLSDQDLAYLELPAPGRLNSAPPSVRLVGSVNGQRGEWHGQLVRTEGVVDESSRLSYAVVQVEDPYGLLDQQRTLPLQMGTFVQADIQGRTSAGLIELPRSALREGDTVYLAGADNKLEIRSVSVARATAHRVYVHNALQPGDRVITTAIQAPIPGLSLRVRESALPEPELRLLPVDELVESGAEQAGEIP